MPKFVADNQAVSAATKLILPSSQSRRTVLAILLSKKITTIRVVVIAAGPLSFFSTCALSNTLACCVAVLSLWTCYNIIPAHHFNSRKYVIKTSPKPS